MDFNTLLQITTDSQNTNRVLQLEERERSRKGIRGDWEGTKTGSWQSMNRDGTSVVKVEGKDYTCVTKAWTSIPKGQIVNVVASGGRYYASW